MLVSRERTRRPDCLPSRTNKGLNEERREGLTNRSATGGVGDGDGCGRGTHNFYLSFSIDVAFRRKREISGKKARRDVGSDRPSGDQLVRKREGILG